MGLVPLVVAVTVYSRLRIPSSLTCDFNGARVPCSELSAEAMTFFLVAFVGGAALGLMGLHRLARLFGNYSRGEIFTRGSVHEIRMLGYVVVAYVVFRTVLFVVMLSLVADGAEGWPRELRYELPFGPALIATFISLLSWIMDVGAEQREENELTV
jgi:hypothetical protein